MGETVTEPIGTAPGANGVRAAVPDASADGQQALSKGERSIDDTNVRSELLEPQLRVPAMPEHSDAVANDIEIGLPHVERSDLPTDTEAERAPAQPELDLPLDAPAADRLKVRRQSTDPTVSKVKFRRELDAYRRHEEAYRSRGWLLIEASFPTVFLVLCVPQLKPPCVLFGLILDFTNYDVEPVSVRVVDPFTKRVLTAQELLTQLPRKVRPALDQLPQQPPDFSQAAADQTPPAAASPVPANPELTVPVVPLLQYWGPADVPFLCLPGVLEYHRHPGHTGNSWLRYRGTGVGTLDAILNAFHTYGVRPINQYAINVSLQQHPDGTVAIVGAQINGFVVAEIPE